MGSIFNVGPGDGLDLERQPQRELVAAVASRNGNFDTDVTVEAILKALCAELGITLPALAKLRGEILSMEVMDRRAFNLGVALLVRCGSRFGVQILWDDGLREITWHATENIARQQYATTV